MSEFQHGPFLLFATGRVSVGGTACLRWQYSYGSEALAEQTLPASNAQGGIIDAFADTRAGFIQRAREAHAADMLDLVDSETDEIVARLPVTGDVGLTPGLTDDRSKYWLRSRDRLRSRDVTLTEFAALAARHTAPERHWIAGLLPDEVTTEDPDEWRAPTSWELRHVVGEGSFTGVSGSAAAQLVGVTPQNFRKYTARDDAKGKQNMSFAMWHLLLHKLGVKRLGSAE